MAPSSAPSPVLRSVPCLAPHGGFHRVAYAEWPGPPGAPTLVCVHGLTRNGRDFDPLARALSERYRVICPDVAGRGRSDWLAVPGDYGYPLYLADMAALLARLDVESVDWVGTSMGGLIGMMLAAQPGNPIRRLVLNDVGPFLPKAALERIGSYVGKDPHFPDIAALEEYLRRIHAPFGPLTAEQWRHLAEHGWRHLPDGSGVGLAYDPHIGDAFQGEMKDVDLWPMWDAMRCPTLVIRGAESDLLRAEDAAAMTQRGPRATLAEFPGIGHAPALMAADQIAAVRDFLAAS
ncbi:MAG TPA: alpha/beta hydrolase [Stellaceae bacterium]